MHVGLGAVTITKKSIHEENIRNASDILAHGTREQIVHLFKLYNQIASRTDAQPFTEEEMSKIIASRGFKGFGDIDWSAIGNAAAKIGAGLASAATAVGPLILQKYQIDKLPSVTPPPAASTPVAPSKDQARAGDGGGGFDWSTIALYGGGALLVGGVLWMVLRKRQSA